jgi:hypothetical protein
MNYYIDKINWDDSLELSEEKYGVNLIQGTIRDLHEDGNDKVTAREWISFEIWLCKKLIEENKRELEKYKPFYKKSIRELTLLKKYFNKYLIIEDTAEEREKKEEFFFYLLNEENISNVRTEVYLRRTEKVIDNFLEYQKNKLNKIERKNTKIKAICKNSIKYILKDKENKYDFSYYTQHLMSINNIEIGKNTAEPKERFNKVKDLLRLN